MSAASDAWEARQAASELDRPQGGSLDEGPDPFALGGDAPLVVTLQGPRSPVGPLVTARPGKQRVQDLPLLSEALAAFEALDPRVMLTFEVLPSGAPNTSAPGCAVCGRPQGDAEVFTVGGPEGMLTKDDAKALAIVCSVFPRARLRAVRPTPDPFAT